jgi:AraC-like DNA-binding protein
LPKTNTHYLGVLMRQAERQGLDVARLLAEAGISDELARADNQWIDNSYLTELVKRLWQETGDEILGIDEQPMRMGSWALVCDYMLAAANLGDLFRRGQRICSYLPPESMGLDFSVAEQSAVVGVQCYRGPRDPEHFLTEFLGVVWHRFPCWAVDEYLPVQQACFSYPAPDHAWFYDTFDRKYLARPVVRSTAELDVWLSNSPADLLYLPGRDTTVGTHIRRQLQGELSTNLRFPAFEQICDTLHMSSQVVRRRLAEEGTSYQKLKDGVRSGLVKELLASPELAIAEIAVRAGFTEPAALSRAFKKWTGQTPAQYREGLLRQSSDQ